MRWDGLFADLEAQMEDLDRAERSIEIGERARIEVASIAVLDRLRPAVGSTLRLRCRGGVMLSAVLHSVGPEWALFADGAGHETLVVLSSLISVSGLGRLSQSPGTQTRVESRLGLGHVLRGIAADRSSCQVCLSDSATMNGTVERVGKDFLELAAHAPGEPRRRGQVRELALVALCGLVAIRRDVTS